MLRQGAETLAGRMAVIEMAGFDATEVGAGALRRLWLRGGFPRSFLAPNDELSLAWRGDFIRTFLERDIAQLGTRVPAVTLRRLWTMLAHFHGQVLNASELARSLGEAHTTVRRHLDLLTGALMVRQLQPWFANIAKRQVKAPKIYVRDSGLLHALLGLQRFRELEGHPKLGASWEGFAVEEIARVVDERQIYFWATQSGAELDLLVIAGGRKYGIEIKYADAPRPTRSMHIAIDDLKLTRLFVVYPGNASFALADRIEVMSLSDVKKRLA
jgi:predicted AAA+ superfamily ATPase